jgi:hypothetical protein
MDWENYMQKFRSQGMSEEEAEDATLDIIEGQAEDEELRRVDESPEREQHERGLGRALDDPRSVARDWSQGELIHEIIRNFPQDNLDFMQSVAQNIDLFLQGDTRAGEAIANMAESHPVAENIRRALDALRSRKDEDDSEKALDGAWTDKMLQ